jgi:hypothetical protein
MIHIIIDMNGIIKTNKIRISKVVENIIKKLNLL